MDFAFDPTFLHDLCADRRVKKCGLAGLGLWGAILQASGDIRAGSTVRLNGPLPTPDQIRLVVSASDAEIEQGIAALIAAGVIWEPTPGRFCSRRYRIMP